MSMPEPGHCLCKFSGGGVLSQECQFHKEIREKLTQARDGFKSQLAAERKHGALLQIRLDEARALNEKE